MTPPFDAPIRYLISDGTIDQNNFADKSNELIETVGLAASAGIEMVQVREKALPARLLFDLARRAVQTAAGSACRILVNDRFDIAMAAGAAGVHLTTTSIPAASVRSHAPDGFLIGVSAHTSVEVREARFGGANFAMFGPVYSTPGKGEPKGLEKLSAVCGSVGDFPVIAVGGIDVGNYQNVLDAGAAGFAAIRYLNDFVRIDR